MAIITTDYGIVKPPPGCQIDYGHPINRGAGGLWLMNEKGGNRLNDYSGNNNHGTMQNFGLNGATSNWIGSPTGGALNFDGTNDYVDCGTNAILNPSKEFALSFWFNRAADTKAHVGKYAGGTTDKGYLLQIHTNNVAYFVVSNAAGVDEYVNFTIPTATNGKWNLLSAVFNANLSGMTNIGKLYLNGVLQTMSSVGAYPATVNASTKAFEIQRYNANTYGNSMMDIVRYHYRALSATEVMQLYSQPCIGIQSPTYYTSS